MPQHRASPAWAAVVASCLNRTHARRGTGARRVAAVSVQGMLGRLCSKIGCAREAVCTLTYDYGDQMAAVGPLGPSGAPHAHDLCVPHAERLSVPQGWVIVRHETLTLR